MIIRKSPFDFFKSKKTALVLLFLFLLLLLVSVVIPQKSYYTICEIEAVRQKHPLFVSIVSKLALDNIFRSILFYVLAAFLSLSVLICTGFRTIKIFFSDYFEIVREQNTNTPCEPETAQEFSEIKIKKKYFNEARIRHAGSILFHISILVMAGGLTITRLFGFNGFLTLTEGHTIKNELDAYGIISQGTFFFENEPAFKITLNKIQRAFKDGYLTGIRCYLTISDGGRETRKILQVNQPIGHNGEEFIISESGYSPHFVLNDADTHRNIFRGYVNITGNMPSGPDFFDIPGENIRVYTRFSFKPGRPLPAPAGDGDFGIYGSKLDIRIENISKDKTAILHKGVISRGEIAKFGKYELAFDDVKNWVVLRGSRDPGRTITFAGFLICVAGLFIRFAPHALIRNNRTL